MTTQEDLKQHKKVVQKHGLTLEERFYSYVDFGETKGSCWKWTSFKDPNGYGRINVKNIPVLAHRLSWEIHNGKIPKRQCVLHGCDNPDCVNPRHLFLGTQKDNIIDCIRKGRDNYGISLGEKHGLSKLTEKDVINIRASKKSGVLLSQKHGVSTTTICDIRKGHIWKHLPFSQEYKNKNHSAKLTKDDVVEIRASKESSEILAKKYGVTSRTISSARFGHTWKHIQPKS